MFHGSTRSRIASWAIVVGLVAVFVGMPLYMSSPLASKHIDTNVFMQQLSDSNIEELHISTSDGSVSGQLKHEVDGVKNFESTTPVKSDEFVKRYLSDTNLQYDMFKPSALLEKMTDIIFALSLCTVMLLAVPKLIEGEGSVSLNDGDATVASRPDTTFDDVCGIPEAIEEISEVVSFLKNPDFYHEAGAKVPKGILLQGEPGCGKTLLARALAGEAGVPFIPVTGSDFIEKFVGVGAKRVRKLFKTAREMQPCIIFIDEIDAIGGDRNSSAGGYDSEHLQTMNQLLTEMDGFKQDASVIVIAATNRGASLDPALLRPGRFDRIITVDNPTKEGRKEILQHYAVGRPFATSVDFDTLAAHTYGFSGAQLENVMNQAATLSARRAMSDGTKRSLILGDDLEEGIARVMSGPAMRSKKPSDAELRQIAYHEAGHAVVQFMLPNCDAVQKISIVSRNVPNVGLAMGYVQTYSEEDSYITTSEKCSDEIAALLAGRCSERMFCGIESAGASDDLKKASQIAYRMADEFAFTNCGEACGIASDNWKIPDDSILRTRIRIDNVMPSGTTRMNRIDAAAEQTLHEQFARASDILKDNSGVVNEIVSVLLDKEQIDADEITQIIDSSASREQESE